VIEVAQGKPVLTNSAAYEATPDRINDGNTNQRWAGGSCTHSDPSPRAGETHNWIRIDLGKTYDLTSVEVWDREDSCCRNRLNTLEIWAGNYPEKFDLNEKCNGPFPASIGSTAEINCRRTGRYVFFTQKLPGALTICEAKVYANAIRDVPPARFAHSMA